MSVIPNFYGIEVGQEFGEGMETPREQHLAKRADSHGYVLRKVSGLNLYLLIGEAHSGTEWRSGVVCCQYVGLDALEQFLDAWERHYVQRGLAEQKKTIEACAGMEN